MSMRELAEMGAVIAAILAAVTLFCAAMIGCIQKLTVNGDISEIEQLRRDVAKTTTGNNEDVIGLAAAINQIIVKQQWYNSRWWSAPFTPNEWDSVKPIEIPE